MATEKFHGYAKIDGNITVAQYDSHMTIECYGEDELELVKAHFATVADKIRVQKNPNGDDGSDTHYTVRIDVEF